MRYIGILGFFLLATCTSRHDHMIETLGLDSKPYTAVMFFAPDCPLCLTFSKSYNELTNSYPQVQFLAVQSGNYYLPEEIAHFVDETKLKATVILDPDHTVAKELRAYTTPEFYLLNSSGDVMYKGLLDNRILNLGNYKQQWDSMYLENAIQNALAGQEIDPKETKAVGCVLEF